MKNIIILLGILTFSLVGCSTASETYQISEDILEDLREEYENDEISFLTLEKAVRELEYIKDDNQEKEMLRLINDSIEKVSQDTDSYEKLLSIQERFDPFLNDEVRSNLNARVAKYAPLQVKLENAGYTMERMEEFQNIYIGKSRIDVVQERSNENTDEFMCEQPCSYLVISDKVVEFRDLQVADIFVIKNENYEVVNPFEVHVMKEEALLDHEYELENPPEWYNDMMDEYGGS